jgi:hypothetical protein
MALCAAQLSPVAPGYISSISLNFARNWTNVIVRVFLDVSCTGMQLCGAENEVMVLAAHERACNGSPLASIHPPMVPLPELMYRSAACLE